MKRNLLAAGILCFALAGVGSAQGTASPAGNGAHYTKAQLKQMAQDAHTPEQYNALAAYYGEQHQHYLQEAADEKQEWARRSQNVMAVAAKYPRPVDSARNLYEYYTEMANETGELTTKYTQLAATAATGKTQ